MRYLLVALSTVLAAVIVVGTATAATRLTGTSGPGFTITLKSGSKLVKTLKPGTYTITVADKSSIHNFHLFGPGVNKKTTVPFTGTRTWTVKLKRGVYTYQCDIHASSGMKATFRVSG